MSKKIKNCFYKKLTFQNFIDAEKRARKHKIYKFEVINYELNLENNLINLINKLKNKSYRLGKYYKFKIKEPKERTIKALPYEDRIVQQWYIEEFIIPYITPKFIFSSFSCIKNRGSHLAISTLYKYMKKIYYKNKSFWILSCDIKKFFYNIKPKILYHILEKYIEDSDLMFLTKLLIYDSREVNETSGIPVGNYTSQYYANIYLNGLDQYIKRTLKIKYYVRYMDNFVLLLNSKEECKKIKELIRVFLSDSLNLELNTSSNYFPNKNGVTFCGFRIFTTHILLKNSNKRLIKKRVNKWNKKFKNKQLDISQAVQSYNSWYGHASHCNSYNLTSKISNNCNFLYTKSTDLKIINELIDLKLNE